MKKLRIFFLFLTIALVVSCKKDKSDDIDLAYDYVNTELGSYVVYQMDSILYDDFNNSVTKKTVFYKEKMAENFTDNLGRPAQRVERYTKDSLNGDWKLARTYYIVKTNKNIEKVEENLRFVSFVFPPVLGETWDGNRFIEPIDN
ncbi:MAG: hypothetical protein M9887_08145, partial [Chitinophagales bacterium]|nr:hypothetical protein [Chitinophagales bacterium]